MLDVITGLTSTVLLGGTCHSKSWILKTNFSKLCGGFSRRAQSFQGKPARLRLLHYVALLHFSTWIFPLRCAPHVFFPVQAPSVELRHNIVVTM